MQTRALVLPEAPEGRNIVAHRFNGGFWISIDASPIGAAQGRSCAAPMGLNSMPEQVPTVETVGYVLSSLTGLAKM
jgi:hypothetical protein